MTDFEAKPHLRVEGLPHVSCIAVHEQLSRKMRRQILKLLGVDLLVEVMAEKRLALGQSLLPVSRIWYGPIARVLHTGLHIRLNHLQTDLRHPLLLFAAAC